MSDPPEGIVEYAYNSLAQHYLEWVKDNKSPRQRYTKALLENLRNAPAPSILDLGCGPGIPVLPLLLEHGARVIANDISVKQCELAKAKFPDVTILTGDMMALDFEAGRFDGIISFYTLFHLPRAKLKTMLAKIHEWLKTGGVFALNLATFDEEEIHGEFFGYGMFWSSYDIDGNQQLLREVGFELLQVEVLEAGEGALEENDPDYGAEFMWVMARKN